MEKKKSIIQVYAIVVNIVAIIAFIISITSLVSAVIDRSDPLYVGGYNQTDLSSFDKYKLDVLNSTEKDDTFIPDDEMIRNMYEDAKTDRINKVKHQSFRSIMVSSLVILLSVILFAFHWWLVKKYSTG